jgi:hypothetical protein
MFENKVPNTIYGPTIEEITGDWGEIDYEMHNFILKSVF